MKNKKFIAGEDIKAPGLVYCGSDGKIYNMKTECEKNGHKWVWNTRVINGLIYCGCCFYRCEICGVFTNEKH